MNKALEYYHGEKSDGYTHFDGHTEIYATYTHTKKYTMMLAHHDLRVVHVSTHVSLREACDRVKKDRVLEVIEIANKACKDMGIENPRIAVAGLNPHCGENGLFGREEIEEITPAIEAAKQITDDIDARYKAFADAEALLINNALVIPRGMSVPAYLATRLNYWEGQYASTGFSNKRLKGIHMLDHYVSMEEYEANRDAR